VLDGEVLAPEYDVGQEHTQTPPSPQMNIAAVITRALQEAGLMKSRWYLPVYKDRRHRPRRRQCDGIRAAENASRHLMPGEVPVFEKDPAQK